MQTSNLPVGQQVALLKTDGTSLLAQVVFGATAGLAPQPAALTGTIIIDPQNVSGVASDSNPPTATVATFTGPVFKSWAGLVAQWGTIAPVLNANTTIVFVSSHTDNTDPVVFWPIIGAAATVIIQGAAPTVVTAGVVLAGTTAKNRTAGANSLLITTLGATAAAGQLIENTTHASRAWAYKALGGNSFSITQPLVKTLGVPGTLAPAEVDTWANGDTVNLLTPIAINLVEFTPTLVDAALNKALVFQCTILDPLGVGTGECVVGESVQLQEVRCQRFLCMLASFASQEVVNVDSAGGTQQVGGTNSAPFFIGGCVRATSVFAAASYPAFDGDIILGGACVFFGGASFGLVFLDAGAKMNGGILIGQNIAYGAHVIYGSGANTINMQGTSHFGLSGSNFTATFTAPGLVTGIQLNGAATGSSITGAGAINQGITTTPAHLDAAAGAAGFGSNAFNFGGASCSNFT
jgi:hypothetical protein